MKVDKERLRLIQRKWKRGLNEYRRDMEVWQAILFLPGLQEEVEEWIMENQVSR